MMKMNKGMELELHSFLTRNQIEVSGQPRAPAALHRRKQTRYPLNKWLCGPQSRYGGFGEQNLLLLPGSEARII
jgi:hypothetical protein